VLVCYRNAAIDPVTDPSLKTVLWSDPPLNRPPQPLIGVQYNGEVPYNNGAYVPYVVTNSGNWVYANTGFKNGDSVKAIVGYEADGLLSQYPQPNAVIGTYATLSSSPIGNGLTANSSVYQAPSGAWVFGAGTMDWSLALDNILGYNLVDARIKQTTANILNRFVGPDFTLSASPSSQAVLPGGSTSYGVTISPTSGFTGQVSLSVSGLPSGASGSFTPNPATASSTLSVTTSASTATGTYTLTITGVSGSLTHSITVSLTTVGSGVTYDNKVSSDLQFGVATVTTPSFTIGSRPNRAAMIMVAMSANGATSISASLGGVNGTLVAGTDSGTTATIRTMIFQVINPPSGSQNATVSWTGAMNVDVGVITVSGADQTTPVTNGTFAASNAAPAATTSVTITSKFGDMTASVGYTTASWVTPFTNQTLKWGVDQSVTGGDIGPGTGTTTHTWTDQFSAQTHSVSGANFKAAGPSSPDFTLSASPSSQTVTQGGSTSYGVTIGPTGGFTGQVTLSVSGLPSGASGSFTPNPATASSTLSVTTTTSTPAGSYTLTMTGVSGSLTHTTTVVLVVVSAPDFTLSASPSSRTVTQGGSTSYGVTIGPTGGFTGQVTLSVSGLPGGATGSFAPNPATASSTLSVTTATSTPAGSYTLTITGVSGSLTHTITVVLVVVSAPDFALSASPSSQTVTQGGSTSYGVTIGPTGGFTGQVTLSVSGLPGGASGSFTPNPATASSTLSVTTATSTPAGSYTLTMTGVSGSLTHTTTVVLAVMLVSAPDFTLSALPSSRTVPQGGSTSYSVTINPIAGFAGQVTLSVSGLPTGATGSFTPNPSTASSTLSVTTSTSTPAGASTLTITGISGSLTHTTTVALTVARPGVTYDNQASSDFQWGVTTANTPPFLIGSGANRAAMIMVTMSANGATNITARLGGVSGTLIAGTDSGTTAAIRTMIFQVINPPSGSQTATVSWTGSMNVDVGVLTVSGADQTTPGTNGTFAAANSTAGTSTSVTIASNAGDLTASVGYSNALWTTPFTNQTLKWGIDQSVTGGDIGPGTGTTTHTWTDQYSGQTHAVSGANFKASATP
jgi:uncharacterized membrane protein